jgi:hypothetical protein
LAGFSRIRPNRIAWLAGLLVIVATAAWLASAWDPASVATPDSATYIDGARSLAEGDGFTTARTLIGQHRRHPVAVFPPGFSAMMAPAIRGGASPKQSASWVLAASFIAYAASSYLLLVAVAGARWWPAALLLTGTLIFQPGVLLALDRVLSDLPSAALTTFALWLALLVLASTDRSRGAVFGVGVALALPVLVRWAGLYLAIAICFGFLVSLARPPRWRDRLGCAGWMASGVVVVVAPWLLRNLARTGNATGPRRVDPKSPIEIAKKAFDGLASGFFDAHQGFGDATAMAAIYTIAVCLAVALLLAAFVSGRIWNVRSVRLLCISAAGYGLLMIASAALSLFDPLDRDRFWLPIWPIVGAIALGTLARAQLGKRRRAALGVVVSTALALTAWGFHQQFWSALPRAGIDGGYYRSDFRETGLVARALDHPSDCTLVTNNTPALLVNHDAEIVYRLPYERGELQRLFRSNEPLCIVFYTARDASSAQRGRRLQRHTLRALRESEAIRLIEANAVGELWVTN